MIDLHSIVLNLKSKEKDFIRRFYTSKQGKECKKLKLFDLILKSNNLNNFSGAKILYNKKPNSTFSQLKRRLKNDLLHFIFLFESEEEEPTEKIDTAKIKCTNLILQSDILKKRELFEESLNTLKNAEALAQKYEFFDLLITINDRMVISYKMNGEHKQLDKCREKIKSYQDYQNLYMQIKYFYQEVKLVEFHGFINDAAKKQNSLENWESISNKLNQVNHNNHVSSIKYWYLKALMQFRIFNKDYIEAHKLAINSLALIEEKQYLFPESYKTKVYLDIAKINVYLKEYDISLKMANTALQTKENKDHIKIRAYELFYYAYMGKREYKEALDVILHSEKLYMNNANNDIKYKCLYFKANVKFMQEDYGDSMKCLQQIYLAKYDRNFVICYKILELMIIAEFEDYSWYENKMENFRKLLSPYRNGELLRGLKIFQVLKSLLDTNFNFKKTLHKESENLTSIYANYTPHSKNPIGYEIIRLDEWLKGKEKAIIHIN
ncbi:MAG: hypothetical protein GQ564_21685 [Bacteroidales bacterium]|nr:hypothetical protein [Bacteroidales bacterium]